MIRISPEVLDRARDLHGLTSDQALADALGLSMSTVSNLRRGLTTPTIATAMALKKLTGLPLDLIVDSGTTTAA